MAYSIISVPAGTTSTAVPLLLGQNITAGPAVQGGTVQILVGNTQSGPFTATTAASSSTISYRPEKNQWVQVVSATQAATAYIFDVLNNGKILVANSPIDSANTTSETQVFSIRIPPNTMSSNFTLRILGNIALTNNANVKSIACRIGGLAGTSFFTSPSLASNANYNFEAEFSGIGDGATLKGYGAGATGGWGLSTTAYTTLSTAYLTTETEVVITATKATGTDTVRLDGLVVIIY